MVEDEFVKDIELMPQSKVSKSNVSVNKMITEKVDTIEGDLKKVLEPKDKSVKLLNGKTKKLFTTKKVSKKNVKKIYD